jgi:hypothetical protein
MIQRNLNNAFAYDLVPSPSVLTAALKAARRVNDFPTAVRIFEGMYHYIVWHFWGVMTLWCFIYDASATGMMGIWHIDTS